MAAVQPVWPQGLDEQLLNQFEDFMMGQINIAAVRGEIQDNLDKIANNQLPNSGDWLEQFYQHLVDGGDEPSADILFPYVNQVRVQQGLAPLQQGVEEEGVEVGQEEPVNNHNNVLNWLNNRARGRRLAAENRVQRELNANENNPLGRIRVNRPEIGQENFNREKPKWIEINEGRKVAQTPPSSPITEIKAYKQKVEDQLVECFLEKYKAKFDAAATPESFLTWFRALLKEAGAVIAGGFLLQATGVYKSDNDSYNGQTKDIDIYVNCRNLTPFNLQLAKLYDSEYVIQHNASFYCLSFLRKNGIRSVQRLTPLPQPTCFVDNIDIMSVRNSRNVLDVVKNFDLTFCQIWYDGDGVFATHPEHIYNRVGLLQKDYVPLYFNGNGFLERRIKKYQGRGFRIYLDPAAEDKLVDEFSTYPSKPSPIGNCEFRAQDDTYYKQYLSHVLLQWMMSRSYKVQNTHKYLEGQRPLNIQVAKRSRRWYGNDNGVTIDATYTKPLDPTDGYDSEDYDIQTPDQWYPLIQKATGESGAFSELSTLESDESKFWHITSDLALHLKSRDSNQNPLLWNFDNHRPDDPPRDIYNDMANMTQERMLVEILGDLQTSIDTYLLRTGTDRRTRAEGKLLDFHKHKLEEGISKEGFKSYLDLKLNLLRKWPSIHCFIAQCNEPLTISEISAFTSHNYFVRNFNPARDRGPARGGATRKYRAGLRKSQTRKH